MFLTKILQMRSKNPIVVILGATGTGKSKLALEIAKKFNGEVISADSMQVYQGLDIVTNKVTEEEQDGVPHHMLNFLNPLKNYTVADFQEQTLPIIHQLHNENKLPVIVGGTHYYIEALLWNILIKPQLTVIKRELEVEGGICKSKKYRQNDEDSLSDNENVSSNPEERDIQSEFTDDVYSLNDEEVLKRLKDVDPDSANRYHPNETRKLRRSLEIYLNTGVTQTVHFEQQKKLSGGKCLGGEIRFPNTALIWIQCEKDVLRKRLDGRVGEMIKTGLVKELLNFHQDFNSTRCSGDLQESSLYTNGIFQSIGFKEFHNYLIMEKEERESDAGEAAYQTGIEDMMLHTRQYATRQIRWIRNRLLLRDRDQLPVYVVDGTDPALWESSVNSHALEIVDCLLKGEDCIIKAHHVETENADIKKGDRTRHLCEICDKCIIGNHQWVQHIRGNKHKKMRVKKAQNDIKEKDSSLTAAPSTDLSQIESHIS